MLKKIIFVIFAQNLFLLVFCSLFLFGFKVVDESKLTIEDKWIKSKLNKAYYSYTQTKLFTFPAFCRIILG